jgi:hypothetical protein
MDQVIARNKWEKMISGKPYGVAKLVKITVNAELVKRGGNEYPYFSLTGEISRNDKRFRDPIIACGCIHDEILHHFPQLAPLAAVHLSAADGQPMHAEANARYWAGLTKYEPKGNNPSQDPTETDENGTFNPSILAKHLQTDETTAREVRKGFLIGLPWDRITAHLGLIELWSKQAGAARKLLNDVKQVANV